MITETIGRTSRYVIRIDQTLLTAIPMSEPKTSAILFPNGTPHPSNHRRNQHFPQIHRRLN